MEANQPYLEESGMQRQEIGGTQFTYEDWEASATIRDIKNLDRCLNYIKEHADGERMEDLLDFGCGFGALTVHVADRLGLTRMYGLDRDERRLAVARERGIATTIADIERDPFPVDDVSQDVLCSFGVFEHLVYYDHPLREARRVLRPAGWLIVAMPNLASYLNRLTLLAGAQPRNVEVSREIPAGILLWYKARTKDGKPLGHIHSATLRTMRELLDHYGFAIHLVKSSSPDFGSKLISAADIVVSRIPTLAGRYIIVSRKAT
jgi:SAM-dependent methyltransferase